MIGTGTTLAHYTILSILGRGGMGEVWKALDAKLGREVAIKTLPSQFAEDAESVARFEREAKLLASVNHPHIAAIYGLEEFGGTRFLVLELIEGDTLADRVDRGPISVEETLKLAHQIAGALEAAHEKGIVHRDLKPANIKVTPDGSVKVLDFGVGKLMANESHGDLSNSPTIGATATREGVILGTAAYMAPEQARGRAVDKRADVWGFGCVLFEMLTGHAPFQGENVSDILASVLKSNPDWDSLPPNLNPRLLELLHRCLQKDPQQRYRDVGDVRLDIEGLLADPSHLIAGASGGMGAGAPSKLPWLAGFVLALLASAAVWYLKPAPAPALDVTRLFREIPTSPSLSLGQNFFAVSREGDQFAYATGDGLFLCRMDEFEGRRISGTEGEATSEPFFSPDGQWIGYVALGTGQLKKVRTTGGKPTFLAEVKDTVFAPNWTDDGSILYVQQPRIMRVAENGGSPSVLVDVGQRVVGPVLLPDKDSLLFTVGSGTTGRKVMLRSLASGDQTELFQDAGTAVQYVASGHLVYGSGDSVSVRAFNTETRAVGNPVPLVQSFFRFDKNTAPQFRVSQSGTLVYLPSAGAEGFRRESLALLDRRGNVAETLSAEMADYGYPRFSPDDKRIAVQINRDGGSDIAIFDRPTGILTQLTFDGGTRPLWSSPDGKEIAFLKDKAIWTVPTDFRGTPTLVPGSEFAGNRGPGSWSSDGAVILFSSDAGIHALHRRNPTKTTVIIPASEGKRALFPEFSPDNHWIVYTLGAPVIDPEAADLYVSPYPGPGDSRRITTGGGTFPIWIRKPSEILYTAPRPRETTSQGLSLFLALPITTELTRRNPDELFRWLGSALGAGGGIGTERGIGERPYDVSHDGQNLVVARRDTAEPAAFVGERPASAGETVGTLRIHVVRNWIEEMKARVPAP